MSAGGENGRVALVATAARLESTRASDLANAQAQIDVAVFTQWADAYASGDKQLRDFYFERFRPEFKPAVVAWIATRPLKNPNAPLTPFAMPQYTSKARADAARLETEADAWSATARRNVQRSTNYVLGMSTKLPSRRLGVAMLTMGVVVFACTLVWVAVSPVSVSV